MIDLVSLLGSAGQPLDYLVLLVVVLWKRARMAWAAVVAIATTVEDVDEDSIQADLRYDDDRVDGYRTDDGS